jgi:hypothetical protein
MKPIVLTAEQRAEISYKPSGVKDLLKRRNFTSSSGQVSLSRKSVSDLRPPGPRTVAAWQIGELALQRSAGEEVNLFGVPTGGTEAAAYTTFATWLGNASATNMAYALSAQLATMELNVLIRGRGRRSPPDRQRGIPRSSAAAAAAARHGVLG